MIRMLVISALILTIASCAEVAPVDGDPITPVDTPPDPDATDAPPTGAEDNSPEPTLYDEYFDEADLIGVAFGWFDDPFRTRLSNLPTTGSSTYDGVLGVVLPQGDTSVQTLGDLNLTLFFDDSPGTGSVTQMIDETNQTYVGTLAIGGVIVNTTDTSAPSFAGDLSGTLIDTDTVEFAIDGTLSGDFFLATDYVAGDVTTDVTVDGQISATQSEFIATSVPQ
ncbi:hypothetical protein JQU17_04195 [Ponticoccus sp. SC2-23]|uniref:hypothetical protein n=1 Tax=Alexandriicola marinus TaxID=2081710 RepID=UPI000FDB46CA|nr:hypothetical protein [Alexandriicola marinus]MBM1219386.1 hypothetical protein [Ponticoccus sp. SC6-9]MBM1223542.1 hypothetical protein [Ponticoccus sp. SC6-15]MBM1229199.1 hypothetical protein [Ponticoccus sp. SC6-38]MBM1232508.1 hypothetical protein [Ponticoccus sp. SC6-45]MBM1237542.1 hypothetical protein [Ponticoccus sp. SC6-49]MBM1241519.1 hypothetical protein [Ponticoccus sp. SC2-64]MBM1246032.1 hypothetical protein [Ponticoccus sp. SC6-42]MBM1250510.1 hypothetical protein [Pontico